MIRKFPASPTAMIASIWQNRELIHSLAKREILGRYRGSLLGLFWSFLTPLFMLAVYTFVFSEVFKARWSTGSESKTEFALILFAGLIVFNLFAECINRAPSLILSHPNYVKKVVFPLEILPVVGLLSALYHMLISLAVWLLAYLLIFGIPPVTALLLPLVIIPLSLFTLGLSWLLASIGVFLRDVSQFIGVLTMAMMFLSPIFYPISALPKDYQILLQANPLTPAIETTRQILYWGQPPSADIMALYWAVTLAIAWLGYGWFQKTRKGFSDVL